MRKIINRLVSGLRWRLLLLVLLACAPLVGLTLHTASEERRRLVKEWKRRSQEMMEMATREEDQVIGQTRQLLLALAKSVPVRSGNRRGCDKLLGELFGSYHRMKLMHGLNVHDIPGLVRFALRLGLIPQES